MGEMCGQGPGDQTLETDPSLNARSGVSGGVGWNEIIILSVEDRTPDFHIKNRPEFHLIRLSGGGRI